MSTRLKYHPYVPISCAGLRQFSICGQASMYFRPMSGYRLYVCVPTTEIDSRCSRVCPPPRVDIAPGGGVPWRN